MRRYSIYLVLGLWGLSACSGASSDAPGPLPPVSHAPLSEARLPLPPSGTIIVQAGDTLYRLATRYQVTPQSIIRDNHLDDPHAIYTGMQLKISPRRFHEVKRDDNLYSLSQRYAISQYQLAEANGLKEPYALFIGQKLILPDTLDFSILDLGGDSVNNNLPNNLANNSGANSAANSVGNTAPLPKASPSPRTPPKSFATPAIGKAGFTWPVQGEIIEEFGPVAHGIHNDGVKIKADRGTIVTTSAPGTVAYVGNNLKSFGSLILVKHEGGYISAYAHLDNISVREGDNLQSGTAIGQVGTTGRVASPQLHFEIRRSRTPVNPRDMIT